MYVCVYTHTHTHTAGEALTVPITVLALACLAGTPLVAGVPPALHSVLTLLALLSKASKKVQMMTPVVLRAWRPRSTWYSLS
jgi:multisubunit Na+/H+ antiporter MnhG subunit